MRRDLQASKVSWRALIRPQPGTVTVFRYSGVFDQCHLETDMVTKGYIHIPLSYSWTWNNITLSQTVGLNH